MKTIKSSVSQRSVKAMMVGFLGCAVGAWLATASSAAEPVSGKGMVIQGNQLKAMPGYVLGKGSTKRVLARPAGGGLGFDADCGCHGGTGDCDIAISGGTAICSRSPGAPCSGSCGWTLGKGMKMMK